jgi:hypothetical protein
MNQQGLTNWDKKEDADENAEYQSPPCQMGLIHLRCSHGKSKLLNIYLVIGVLEFRGTNIPKSQTQI